MPNVSCWLVTLLSRSLALSTPLGFVCKSLVALSIALEKKISFPLDLAATFQRYVPCAKFDHLGGTAGFLPLGLLTKKITEPLRH